ncbi:MAG: M3 family metallopeptidase [Proteobacteria bacterium]|nr:M3 family metallopeptidase [Pseudomonadota bacterium]
MSNPLLSTDDLPNYQAIRPEHAEPAIRAQLEANRRRLAELLSQPEPTFSTLVEPFEEMQHRLNRVFAPVAHLNAVTNSDALRAAYNVCLPLLTEYQSEVGQNEALARAYETIKSREAGCLTAAQRRVLDFALREFELAGVRLPAGPKDRFKALMQELAQLQSRFEEQVLDATQAWSRPVADEALLAGLPTHVTERAAAQALAAGQEGWLLKLDQPTYVAVVTHAVSVALRREFYQAWTTRASDQGHGGGGFDNGPVLAQILQGRHEAAKLLGYGNYAQLSLATKMAATVAEVIGFLEELAGSYVPAARRELTALEAFAGRKLDAWDVPYYADKLQQQLHSVSEEALRPWFPLPRVLSGLFAIAERLYGLTIQERGDVTVWHPDARYFEIRGRDGAAVGGFYTDLYARDQKRGGAWMGEVTVRKRLGDDATVRPIANIVCNFTPPSAGQPALLTHGDVVTLFHEFGHALHHLLTRIDYPSVAGINGVPWDAVELPSQMMENWAWQPEVLPLVSAHVTSGEPLPAEMLERLLGTRTFHAGLAAVRQLEFALFDFQLHSRAHAADLATVHEVVSAVREQVGVVRPPEWNRFACSFLHVFSGGYAAGYYSYKWAEVLAADAFAAFAEAGVFDRTTADRFLNELLSQGGSRDQMDAFVAFRGRRPDIRPLLHQHGIAA